MADIKKSARNIFSALMKGELLLRMRFDRFFVHLLYFFVLIWFMIYFSLKVDQTLMRMEKNRIELENLKIYHAQKTSELAGYDRLSTIEKMLEESGSKVAIPQKPADRIRK
ncbi:MAG: hypothetical protein J6B62_06125 [Bacteroidales bacterium]|jgi:hypothetical protein|nr:hypothetical protein [Bacteroidales bacterium]